MNDFVLFDWALDSEIQLWVGPCCGVQPLAQGVGVFVTPLLPHLLRERPANQSVDLIRERVLGGILQDVPFFRDLVL